MSKHGKKYDKGLDDDFDGDSENASRGREGAAGMFFSFALAMGLLAIFLYLALYKRPEYAEIKIEGYSMGVFYSVAVSGITPGQDKTEMGRAVKEALDGVDTMMSTFRDDSEVCRFNASDSTDWFPVSAETARVVALSQEISRLSGGAFDITVAPLVRLWGFGAGADAESRTTLPSPEEIAACMENVGADRLEVRMDPPALKKAVPGLHIDLSAVAKGYAVDRVAEALLEMKIRNFMIEVGGEVRCHGKKLKGAPWMIGIQAPVDLPGSDPVLYMALEMKDLALATSGDYQNYHELAGQRFSHIIDPRTGEPTEILPVGAPEPEERLVSVSILDPNCARADALATTLFVLGPKAGLALAEREKIPALFLLRPDNTEKPLRELKSGTFPAE